MDQASSCHPHIQRHTATVHHSDLESRLPSTPLTAPTMVTGPGIGRTQPSRIGMSKVGHQTSQANPHGPMPRYHHQHPNNNPQQHLHHHPHHPHHHQQQQQMPRTNQALSFDDSNLHYTKKDHSSHSNYPQSEPQLYGGQNSLRRRRHSSTSRLKSSKHNNNFIASITNNFMSFGAPFLFDWRLFCERGQPRYVHKHEGDGLRVDECEARFLSKIAEEEKVSLNAISDDEEHSSSGKHQQRKSKSGTAAANVECLGSVRKSGFLSVKKWLIRKKTSLELARKRGWKGYWVCLKGTTLLFYRCDCGDNKSGGHVIEARPRHLIFVDACLVQAIPEHPKRDFVFCLSTAFGDAYLLDAPCLVERDHWIAAIHCACAAQLARSSGRMTVSHVLHKEIKRLDEAVDLDTKAKTEAEQIISTAIAAGSLTAVEAKEKQQQLMSQIHNLEEKVEKNRTEIFRFRAYLAALVSEEDPNPKTLLSQTTRRSKMQLNRLGVFNVSSLHAFNCAKNPTIIGNITRTRSTEENLGAEHIGIGHDLHLPSSKTMGIGNAKEVRASIVVKMLNGEHHKFDFNATLSGDQVLGKLLPAPIARDYYLRHADDSNCVFKRHETVLDHTNETLEIVPKIMFTCEMTRESHEILFGFSVESELCQDDLRVYVSRVEASSLAALQSLKRSDEIVVINGALVQDLDMMYVESVLQEELALCLTIRAARDEICSSRPTSRCTTANMTWNNNNVGTSQTNYSGSDFMDIPTTDDLIESLVCPPPPPIDASQMILSDKQLSKFIVPKVDNYLTSSSTDHIDHKIRGSSRSFNEHHSSQLRSLSSKSGKSSTSNAEQDTPTTTRPHSAAASYQRNHHHHHHHGHHSRNSSTVGGGGGGSGHSHHHHHHHHHHHSSTKHVYHIADPQTHLYGLLEQHLINNQPVGTIVLPSDGSCPMSANMTNVNLDGTDLNLEQTTAAATSASAANMEMTPTTPLQSETVSFNPNEQINEQPINEDHTAESNQRLTTFDGSNINSGEMGDLVENNMVNQQCSETIDGTEHISTKCTFGSEITNEKLRKVIYELVDTEITYCQALDQLMTLYLDPLLKSCTLTNMDARKLIGAIPQVIITQNQFREDLTTIVNDDELNIEGIAKCFLNYSNDFKNYSTFCASHMKAIKLLADEKSILHEWLTKQSKTSKNPNMYSLESYLIRPIQRILKYPLLLNQIKTLCPKDSQPYFKMNEALRAVENVAEHINEMQRINEEYGAIFENLIANTKVNSKKNNIFSYDLNPISLIHYGGVDWINSVEFLGKSFRKNTSMSGGINLHSMCFVFKQCVVFLCKETIRHKSKKQSSSSDVEIIKHQVLIPVSEVQVRASTQSEHELDFKWELIQLKTSAQGKRSEKIFRLSNSTNEYRNSFLRTIRQIIREDVRRMSVMNARPGTMRAETSPTAKKSEKRHMVSFASTQNLTRCGFCGEDFTKMVKKGS